MIYAGTGTSHRSNSKSIIQIIIVMSTYTLLGATVSSEEILPAMTRDSLWSVLTSVAAARMQMRSVRSASALAGCYSDLTNGAPKVGANTGASGAPRTRCPSNSWVAMCRIVEALIRAGLAVEEMSRGGSNAR